LNPYEAFKTLQPTAVIDYGVFVYDGHFEIPLAAALAHAHKAQRRLSEKRLSESLAEARQAVTLAPDAVKPNVVLGDIPTATGQAQQARPYYTKALAMAKAVEPEFQVGWVNTLEGKLAPGAE